ncbi:MAG: terminase gpA endonuclease subunit [Fuerstiella sp.]
MISRTVPKYELENQRVYRRNALAGILAMMEHARPKRVRPILDFAEAEMRYPTGRFKGQRFDRRYQPATSLLMEQMADPKWLQTFVVGPHQAGKSLSIAIFAMWILFEKQEDLIYGMPDIGMRAVKWQKDLRPMIASSRYEQYLPRKGAGSQGGVSELILFENSVSITFMGAGGGDTQRAGATSRNLIITEAESFGTRAAKSDEGSKFEQILGRVSHFAGSEKVIAESTITTEDGLMWSEYSSGSQSVVKVQCHACYEHVAPEREHLVGWESAKTEDEARHGGRFSCPECGILWNEEQRRANLQTAVLVHAGQVVGKDGVVSGELPPTQKLGFRFSAATNAFADAGSIAVEEFGLKQSENAAKKDSKDRALNQFRFAKPVVLKSHELDSLDGRLLLKRAADTPRGVCPAGTTKLFGGMDVRKTQLHWAVIAFSESSGPRIIQWGMEQMRTEGVLFEDELLRNGKIVQARFTDGFQIDGSSEMLPVSLTLCDAGWKTWHVQTLCDLDDWWMPSMGFGTGILKTKGYKAPRSSNDSERLIGDSWHMANVGGRELVELDASNWKSTLHQRLRLELSNPYALSFAGADETELRELISHITSEKEIEEYIGGEVVTTFTEPIGENHWLDASYYALAAGSVERFVMGSIEDEEEEWDPATAITLGESEW